MSVPKPAAHSPGNGEDDQHHREGDERPAFRQQLKIVVMGGRDVLVEIDGLDRKSVV